MKRKLVFITLLVGCEIFLLIAVTTANCQTESDESDPNSFIASPPKASLKCIMHTGGPSATFGDGFGQTHGFYVPTWWNVPYSTPANAVDMLYSRDKRNIVMMILEYGPIYSSTNSGMTWTVIKKSGRYEFPIVVGRDGGGFSAVATLYRDVEELPESISTNNQQIVSTTRDGDKILVTINTLNPVPVLTITELNEKIIVSWPALAGDFDLQESPDLRTPNWINVTNPVEKSGDNFSVIIPTQVGKNFYRLKSR